MNGLCGIFRSGGGRDNRAPCVMGSFPLLVVKAMG